jgi:hypothetical protein
MTQREKLARANMSLMGNWPTKSGGLMGMGYSNQSAGILSNQI